MEVSLLSKVTLGFSSSLVDEEEADEAEQDLELGMAGERRWRQHHMFILM